MQATDRNDADLSIRPGTASDLDAVRALLHETWHQVYDQILGPDHVDEVTARWHARPLLAGQLERPNSSFLVACQHERVIAHGFAYLREPATLVISRLYVLPSHQGRGIGLRLLCALQERHPDARTLRLFVAAGNPRAVAFYRREGFAVVEEGTEEGARVLHMEKRLISNSWTSQGVGQAPVAASCGAGSGSDQRSGTASAIARPSITRKRKRRSAPAKD